MIILNTKNQSYSADIRINYQIYNYFFLLNSSILLIIQSMMPSEYLF